MVNFFSDLQTGVSPFTFCDFGITMHVSLVPRLSRSNCGGGGTQKERAWYTLFAHVLIISVIARVCVILENISEVFVMGVYKKILKYPKMYWRTY